jgi:hypothetical protein
MDSRWQGLSEAMRGEKKQSNEYTASHTIIPYGLSKIYISKTKGAAKKFPHACRFSSGRNFVTRACVVTKVVRHRYRKEKFK